MPLYNPITSGTIVDGTIVDADVNASAAIATSKLALNTNFTEILALPKLLVSRASTMASAVTANTRYFPDFNSAFALATTSSVARAGFYFDPADYAITGKTLQLILKVAAITNDTAPAITFTSQIVAATPSGASGNNTITAGSAVSGSSVAIASPPADAATSSSATFTAPSAGFYIIQMVTTQTVATNGDTALRADVYYRHI